MTDAEFLSHPALDAIPVCDERDERAHTFMAGTWARIRECIRVEEVDECLADPTFVPLAGLRITEGKKPLLVVYFGSLK